MESSNEICKAVSTEWLNNVYQCPPREILQRLLDDQVDDEQLAALDVHLSGCSICVESIEQLSETKDTVSIVAANERTDCLTWELEQVDRVANAIQEDLVPDPDIIPKIRGYEIESVIARGGMGIVYKAKQINANRRVALKMLLRGNFSHPEEIHRFLAEAKSAAKLNHPSIVSVYDVGTDEGQHYFTMEYVDGKSLRETIQDGPVSNQFASTLIVKIAEAIAYGHDQGIIHRDLKPANVLLDQGNQPYVADFGLAKQIDADDQLTTTGQILGTPSYMSPEQASGNLQNVGRASDVYSIGAILYALLTGRPPFQASSPVDTLNQVIRELPVAPRIFNKQVAKDLETICLKCLEKSPAKRYSTAEDLAAELKRYQRNQPIKARPISTLERLWRVCKRHPAVSSLSAIVVLTLILSSIVSINFALYASEKARVATEQSRTSLKLVETMIDTVQDKLRHVPGARLIQRQLLESTLAEIEKISDESMLQNQIDRSLANIYIDLGDSYAVLGEENGNDASEKAERYLTLGVAKFEKLSPRGTSEDRVLLYDQSRALDVLGLFYRTHDRISEATDVISQSLEIRRKLVKLDPENVDYQHRVNVSLSGLSICYAMNGNKELAKSIAIEGINAGSKLHELYPERSDVTAALFFCQLEAGNCALDLKQSKSAISLLNDSLETAQFHLKNHPIKAHGYDLLSKAHESIGCYWHDRGELQKASKNYLAMKIALEKAIEIDPESIDLKDGLACAYELLHEVHLEMNDMETAVFYAKLLKKLDDELKNQSNGEK